MMTSPNDISSLTSRDVNEPNEHEQGYVRIRSLRKKLVHELFTNAYRTRFLVRVRSFRKRTCSRTFTIC
ncbi:hypothetical protein HanRHA438_Chr03g0102161 [Helianthus annuus]|nr:hypothetical protein HanRHA438_Chr03g0102161 [Helianthus annuus]